MKHKIILITILMCLLQLQSKSNEFEFTPLNINFNGVVANGDTIVAYGDYGSMLMSFDYGENWKQIRVFNSGIIINYFFESDRLVAFGSNGEIKISYDGGISWLVYTTLKENLLAVLSIKEGYVLRYTEEIIKLNINFKVLDLRKIKNTKYFGNIGFKNSMVYFQDNIILSIDTNVNLIKMNTKLEIIDTLSAKDLGICNNCSTDLKIFSDAKYIYFYSDKKIYRSQDFKQIEKIYDCPISYASMRVYDNKMYFMHNGLLGEWSEFYFKVFQLVNKDSVKLITYSKNNVRSSYNTKGVNDFLVVKNRIILASENKLLAINNIGDSTSKIISILGYPIYYENPDVIGNNDFLFYTSGSIHEKSFFNKFESLIFYTSDSGITFNSYLNQNYINDFVYWKFEFKYFDNQSKNLILGGYNSFDFNNTSGAYKFTNNGSQFSFKKIDWFYFNNNYKITPNMYKSRDNYIIGYNTRVSGYTPTSTIVTFDDSFNKISHFRDSNYTVFYSASKDTNTFLLETFDDVDSTIKIKYTENKGINWDIIKRFLPKYDLLYNREVSLNDTTYLAFAVYNESESTIIFSILNLESREYQELYSYKYNILDIDSKFNNALTTDSNKIFMAINDTIFEISNIKDVTTWKKTILPNNGKIRKTFKKYGDKYLARYSDKNNLDNLYWIKINFTPKQKPEISSEDRDFGKIDIKDKSSVTRDVYIGNNSKTEKLEVYSYLANIDSAFTTDLPKIDKSNPLIIDPSTYYHFLVTFKPNKVKKYNDSIIFHSNAIISDSITYLRGEGIDTVKSSVTEEYSYFYSWDPYPIPGVNQIKFYANWDSSSDIDTDKKIVFDLFGNEIGKSSDLKLFKNAPFSGYFVWDCLNIPTGIYIIQINHGTSKNFIPVMVVR